MNVALNYFAHLPKRFVTVALALLSIFALTTTVALADFGPDRPTKEWQGDGTSGFSYITFNSFTGVPGGIGDERDFMRAKIVGEGTTTVDPLDGVEDGDELYITMWVHNNADPSLNSGLEGIARDLRVMVDLPTEAGTSMDIDGTITASNAQPTYYTDTVTINGDSQFELEYVPGSANIVTHELSSVALSDDLVNGGVAIGYDELDGTMPGCFEYGAWVNFRVVVKEAEEPEDPVYECSAVDILPTGDRKVKVTVDASGSPEDRVSITGYSYDFGDGNTTDSSENMVNHTYADYGSYDINVTVHFEVDGQAVTVDCGGSVTFEEEPETPVYECSAVGIIKTGERKIKVTVTASGSPEDRVSITGYSYDFGDGNSEDSDKNTATHTYEKVGKYTVDVVVSFLIDGEIERDVDCSGNVTFEELPPELPDTGPAGIFAALFGTSTLGAAIRGWKKSRNELAESLLG